MTAVELIAVLSVLVVATSLFAQTVASLAGLGSANRETSIAASAARATVETLMSEDFGRIFVSYNADPADDPDGPGTAPGARFAVAGLDAVRGASDGMVGTIEFPGATEAPWALREDVEDARLGMPRDLDGDLLVDTADHRYDHTILPVRVHLRWRGKSGTRELAYYATLAHYAY